MDKTLKELNVSAESFGEFCIKFPKRSVSFEIDFDFIQLLPKFHAFTNENAYLHLKEFKTVCTLLKPLRVPEDEIFLRAFTLSLEGSAREWLYYLPPNSITCWKEMEQMFLQRFFTEAMKLAIRKDICGIQQFVHEDLYDYWERFKKLCASCPHQIPDHLLIVYFYEGLIPMCRSILDVASGGVFMDKTPSQGRELIEKMASNIYQYKSWDNFSIKENQNHKTQPIERQFLNRAVNNIEIKPLENSSLNFTARNFFSPSVSFFVNNKQDEISNVLISNDVFVSKDELPKHEASKEEDFDDNKSVSDYETEENLKEISFETNAKIKPSGMCSVIETSKIKEPLEEEISAENAKPIENLSNYDKVEEKIIEKDDYENIKTKTETLENKENDISDIVSLLELDLNMLDKLPEACTCGKCNVCIEMNEVIFSPNIAVVSVVESSIFQVQSEGDSIIPEKSAQKEPWFIKSIPVDYLSFPQILNEKVAALLEGSWHLPLLLFEKLRKEEFNDGVQRFLTYHPP